jgi:hypothetical protein
MNSRTTYLRLPACVKLFIPHVVFVLFLSQHYSNAVPLLQGHGIEECADVCLIPAVGIQLLEEEGECSGEGQGRFCTVNVR